eukprot:1904623-Pyramimonas_sp.AAC.1
MERAPFSFTYYGGDPRPLPGSFQIAVLPEHSVERIDTEAFLDAQEALFTYAISIRNARGVDRPASTMLASMAQSLEEDFGGEARYLRILIMREHRCWLGDALGGSSCSVCSGGAPYTKGKGLRQDIAD